jgi:antitoxin ParD1/3/4
VDWKSLAWNAGIANLCAISYNNGMAQMNISIPEKLKGWAEARVAEGRYSSTSDYVRDLVRRDQEAEEARRRLQAAIDEGRASGISKRTIEDIIADARERRAR